MLQKFPYFAETLYLRAFEGILRIFLFSYFPVFFLIFSFILCKFCVKRAIFLCTNLCKNEVSQALVNTDNFAIWSRSFSLADSDNCATETRFILSIFRVNFSLPVLFAPKGIYLVHLITHPPVVHMVVYLHGERQILMSHYLLQCSLIHTFSAIRVQAVARVCG